MRKERKETILAETTSIEDWSATLLKKQQLPILILMPLLRPENEYKKRNPKYAEEVDNWSNEIFLNKQNLLVMEK